LPDWDFGKQVVYAEGCSVGHSAAQATGAEPAPSARKPDNATMPTLLTSDAQKTVGQNAAAKVGRELVLHEGRQLAAFGLDVGEKLQPVRLHGPVEHGRLRLPAFIRRRLTRRRVGMADRSLGKHR